MILMVWLTAVVVSIAPLFGWKDPDFLVRVNEQKKCLVSQDLAYQIFATMATFYVPLTAILILYWKIFQAARNSIHKSKFGAKKKKKDVRERANRAKLGQRAAAAADGGGETSKPNGVSEHQQTTAFTTISSGSPDKSSNNGAVSVSSHISEVSRLEMLPKDHPHHQKKSKKESLEAKREKKAAKTFSHHHWGFRRVLVTFLRHGLAHAHMSQLLLLRCHVLHLSVVGVLQLHPQPNHLHHL
ncbi:hypothetical protein Pmani_040073 [Petrolisthes manimaculis]|uniref:G-protein coupled receptors family 1 profile domain-containing protein n=1 Tax=Petrolisthes manimaculis TaxID=1843537 RepID=A0AAE1ND00_9EUCA|nr:hypothetical protein Pmani_040073 [Petrolisthes manimaculis]